MLDYARSFWSFFWFRGSWVRGFVGGFWRPRLVWVGLCGWVTWVPVYVKDGAGAVGFTACASLSWRVYHHEICSGVSVCGMYLGALGRGVGQRDGPFPVGFVREQGRPPSNDGVDHVVSGWEVGQRRAGID